MSIPGYALNRNDRKGKKGGGTAIYIREDIHFTLFDAGSFLPSEIEGTLVDMPHLNLFVLCLYVRLGSDSSVVSVLAVSAEGPGSSFAQPGAGGRPSAHPAVKRVPS